MPIRVLLTPLFHSAEDQRALDTAFILAKRFQAHVDALLVQPDPADTVPFVGEGISADTIKRLMDSAAAAIEQQRKATLAVFEERLAAADVTRVEQAAMSSGQPSAAFRERTGQSEDVVAEQALLSDLVIFGAARSEMAVGLGSTFETVLLKVRRPLLLTPETPVSAIGHNVAIAWNGTPEAKSALVAAMPFLNDAVAVHLLTAANSNADAEGLEAVANYLAWHGINSQIHVADADGHSVGAMLMQKAAAIGADLLVMGGYGHTRLRERILDGVTYHIVNQPELPILLAH